MTKEKLIEKSIKLYGLECYDFSLVPNIFNVKEKITIICHKKHIYGEEHGKFTTTYDNFINKKHGCPFCSKREMNTEVFVKTAQFIHGNKYDYSLTKYVSTKTKVCIICPKHGAFWVLPFNHLRYECKQCSNEQTSEKIKNSISKFIQDVKKIHNDEYEYDLKTYVNYKTPLRLKHKKCNNWFWQTPSKHIHSQHGCPFCKLSKGQKRIVEMLNENHIQNEIEKKFDFLKNNKGIQRIDVFLNDYNIGIEFQGKQHFVDLTIFDNLEAQIEKDIRKYNLCKEHGIMLFYAVDSLNDVNWNIPIYTKDNTFVLKDIMTELRKIL